MKPAIQFALPLNYEKSPKEHIPRRQQLSGHRRVLNPVTPPRPRQSPVGGWLVSCKCGWKDGPVPKRTEAEQLYYSHVLSAKPVCSTCGKSKALRFMSATPWLCRSCSREISRIKRQERYPESIKASKWAHHLMRKFGITVEEYEHIWQSQNKRCALCQRECSEDIRGFRPHLDHCHTTGKIRSILCINCNNGLGSFKDSPALLRIAATYLESHGVAQKGELCPA